VNDRMNSLSSVVLTDQNTISEVKQLECPVSAESTSTDIVFFPFSLPIYRFFRNNTEKLRE